MKMNTLDWKKAEEYVAQGKAKEVTTEYYHNTYDEASHTASSEKLTTVKMLDPKDCPGMVFYMPCPKSPHGVDIDPTGEYIVGGGKLSTVIPVLSTSLICFLCVAFFIAIRTGISDISPLMVVLQYVSILFTPL